MNYIQQLNSFNSFCRERNLQPLARVIYYTLMDINNKLAWAKEFSATNLRMMAETGIGNQGTFRTARDKLIKEGLIKYMPGRKGKSARYSIMELASKLTVNINTKVDSNVDTKVDSKPDTNPVTINKHKLKHKQDIKEKSKEKSAPARHVFKKPTVEEIQEYCLERKNGIDPVKFFDFYEAKGWRIGNSPMKNWQACVRTWEQRGKNYQSVQQQPQSPKLPRAMQELKEIIEGAG